MYYESPCLSRMPRTSKSRGIEISAVDAVCRLHHQTPYTTAPVCCSIGSHFNSGCIQPIEYGRIQHSVLSPLIQLLFDSTTLFLLQINQLRDSRGEKEKPIIMGFFLCMKRLDSFTIQYSSYGNIDCLPPGMEDVQFCSSNQTVVSKTCSGVFTVYFDAYLPGGERLGSLPKLHIH